MQIAHDSGRMAKKELMEQTGVGKMKATETLKCLTEKRASRMGRIKPARPKAVLSSKWQEVSACSLLPATTCGIRQACRMPRSPETSRAALIASAAKTSPTSAPT